MKEDEKNKSQNQSSELNKKNLKGVAGGGPRAIQITAGDGSARNVTMIGGVVYIEDPPGHWRSETDEEWEARRIR